MQPWTLLGNALRRALPDESTYKLRGKGILRTEDTLSLPPNPTEFCLDYATVIVPAIYPSWVIAQALTPPLSQGRMHFQ